MQIRCKCYIIAALIFFFFILHFSISVPDSAAAQFNESNHFNQRIAAGLHHSLAVKPDGTVAAWGWNQYGQITVPGSLTGAVAVAAGDYHSYALKSDGTVVHWGMSQYGQANIPADLHDAVAIASGASFGLALRSDGTVAAWGNNGGGQTNVPADLDHVIAIAAGSVHSLALKENGTVVGWGSDYYGQTSMPTNLNGVVAIAAGGTHSLALKSDGTVIAWGDNNSGQTDVPAGLTGVVAIAAGATHSLALKSDGTVIAWGDNNSGQTDVPAGMHGVIAADAGGAHNLALKDDGTLLGWGSNTYGQINIPTGLNLIPLLATGAYTDINGGMVVLTFNKDMADPVGCQNQFFVSAGNSVAVASISLDADHKNMILTLSGSVKYQEAVTVSYIPGTIQASSGELLEAFQEQPVTNNVTEPALVPIIAISPQQIIAGETLILDASSSFHSEPNHSIVRFEWDFDCPSNLPGDFQVESQGKTVHHEYCQAGMFTIVLRVVDDAGKTAYASKTVSVDIIGVPSADPGGPYEISWENGLDLNGSNSSDPDIYYGDYITKYSWDINGDGIFDIVSDQAQVHVNWDVLQTACGLTPDFSGNHTCAINLEVTDSTGRKATAQTTLTITNITSDECFIATAAFGTKFEPAVVLLRQFRDKCLLGNRCGQEFVNFYYRFSPPIAGFIAGSESLQILVRLLLLPFIAIAYAALHPGFTLVVAGFIIFAGLYRRVT